MRTIYYYGDDKMGRPCLGFSKEEGDPIATIEQLRQVFSNKSGSVFDSLEKGDVISLSEGNFILDENLSPHRILREEFIDREFNFE